MEVFCGDEVSVSWLTCLLFESLFAASAAGNLILGPELGDPLNAGERYQPWCAPPTSCRQYVLSEFSANVLVGVFGVATGDGRERGLSMAANWGLMFEQ